MIYLYTDAATKGNPGPSGAGVLIINQQKQTQYYEALPVMSNHAAEFEAAILGFKKLLALDLNQETIMFYTDSKIIVDSVFKKYAKQFNDYVDELLALQEQFTLVLTQWQNDKKNKGAHHLAQQGLAVALKNS